MNRSTLVLTVVLAGTALLSGCGQESRPAAAVPVAADEPAAAGEPAAASPARAATPVPVTSKAPAAKRSTSSKPANAVAWGAPALSGEDLDRAVRIAWADAHDVPAARVVGEQLQLGLADSGGLLVGAYQLWVPGGQAHVVVAQAEPRSEAVLVRDVPARPDLGAVAGVVSRRSAHVVAAVALGTTRVEYRASSAAGWTRVDQDSIGLVFPRSSSAGTGEALRLTRKGRTTVQELSAPSAAPGASAPANVLTWPARGDAARGPSETVVAKAYAKAMGAPTAQVRRLWSGDTDGGVRYLVGQAWVPGGAAQTVGFVVRPGREGELSVQPATPRGARAVALLVTEQPGTSTDLLVVVPAPGTTGVSYRATSTAPWTATPLRGAAFVDRAKQPAGDAVRIVGGGDPLVVAVARLLCDGPSCR